MRRIKGEWSGQNGARKNYLTCTKTWPSKHLTEQRRKTSLNHTHSSSFWHKTVATPSIYTKVDTIARARTCDSCFRRAIADTKKIDKYRCLSAEQPPQGIQTQLLGTRKKRTSFSVVCVQPKCLWARAILWQVDRSKDSRTIAYHRSSAKKLSRQNITHREHYAV